jgi:hypothetical protein
MARLRVRIELNRRMAGVPLHKMASVVEETRKFFCLLSEDVQIDSDRGEWLASDFDPESLNFTAEFAGAVSTEQVQAFGAAFSGATSLRKTTIAQFTRIADFLGEDELVGFGLYQSEQEPEPTEWRCLSKRDAMRFGEEIKLLAQAAGEPSPESQLPAVINGSVAGRRLFRDRRKRDALATDPGKLLQDVETNLARRISVLEEEIAEQSRRMRQVAASPDLAQERFEKMLLAMETFWAQAPRAWPQLPAPSAPALPAPVEQAAPMAPPALPAPEITVVPKEVKAAAETVAASEPPVTAAQTPQESTTAPAGSSVPAATGQALVLAPPPAQTAIADEQKQERPIASSDATAPEAASVLTPEDADRKKLSRSFLGLGAAAALAIIGGLAFPEIQRQWALLAAVQALPVTRPKPPAPPALPVLPVPAQKPAQAEPAIKPVVKTVAATTSEPFVGPLIPLDIPPKVKSKIQSEVRVDVLVAIDQEGNVTGAHVSSTKGQSAHLLVNEALHAAKQSRFRPAHEGEKTVASQMVLTFSFKPDSNEF